MFKLSRFLFGIFLITKYADANECHGFDGCCSGYTRNNGTGKCEPCNAGFYGPYCKGTCVYPTYGEGCALNCSCSPAKCNFSHGCLNSGHPPEYNETFIKKIATQGNDQADLQKLSLIHGILVLGIVAFLLFAAYSGVWMYQCSLKITTQVSAEN